MSHPLFSTSRLHATGRSLTPGTVTRTTSNAPGRPLSSSATAPPMLNRANVVSATPIRLRAFPARFLVTLVLLQFLPQLPVFGDLLNDLPRPIEVPDEVREAHDLRAAEPASAALLEDAPLVVRLVEAEGDHVRADLREDRVDVPLIPQRRAVHGLQRSDHLDTLGLRHNRTMLETLRRAVARDDDHKLVAELLRLGEVLDVPGVEQVEHARRHHTDHARHASRISRPSRYTRVRASAYRFASSGPKARPSSPSISQIVAEGVIPAIRRSAVTSSVCPFRSSSNPAAGFRRTTWPGARNSWANACLAHP